MWGTGNFDKTVTADQYICEVRPVPAVDVSQDDKNEKPWLWLISEAINCFILIFMKSTLFKTWIPKEPFIFLIQNILIYAQNCLPNPGQPDFWKSEKFYFFTNSHSRCETAIVHVCNSGSRDLARRCARRVLNTLMARFAERGRRTTKPCSSSRLKRTLDGSRRASFSILTVERVRDGR